MSELKSSVTNWNVSRENCHLFFGSINPTEIAIILRKKPSFFTVYYVARVIFYSMNLSTLVPEIIEVLADSSTESTTEPNPADAAFQLYLEKYGHYSATM